MSVPLKVLFVGFENAPAEKQNELLELCKVDVADKNTELLVYIFKGRRVLPCLLDYHVVFVNLPIITPWYYLLLELNSRIEEIKMLLNAGGIIVAIATPNTLVRRDANDYRGITNYLWCPHPVQILNKSGEAIRLNSQHPLSRVLKKYKARWECCFDTNINERVIGQNIANLPVSLSLPCLSGYIILMPQFEGDYSEILRDLLDGIKQNYLQKGISQITTPTPTWITKYQFEKERDLTQEFEKIKLELQHYGEIRKILYTNGLELTKSVALLFSELGFKVTEKEYQGMHDIEVEKDDFFGLIEVKGLKGYANVDDLRQLLDHHIEMSKQKEDIKGIFVVNHYREEDPDNRKESFSRDAIRLGTRNEFCMMSTIDLFKIYSDYIKGNIKVMDITKLIRETCGPLKYP